MNLRLPPLLALLATLSASVLFSCAVISPAERLKSPWDEHPVALTDAPYNCPVPPPFSKSLEAGGYYIDAHHSVVDPVKKAAYEKAAEAPDHLGEWTTQAADAYLRHGSRAGAKCVYALLSAAAAAKAWSATMATSQAHYVQKWLLAGTAMAYLKVRNRGAGTADQDREVQKWFGILADQVRDYVDDKMKDPNSDAWNNHRYWAGLAVCAAGIARNDKREFHFGMEAFKAGVDEIGPSGALPRELERAGMALHYHLYALAPLIMLAELGEANGIDTYSEDRHALDRLVNLSEQGLLRPEIFKKATGVEQNMPDKISGAVIGWAVPYVKRHPDAQLSAWIAQAGSTSFWQWGGLPPG